MGELVYDRNSCGWIVTHRNIGQHQIAFLKAFIWCPIRWTHLKCVTDYGLLPAWLPPPLRCAYIWMEELLKAAGEMLLNIIRRRRPSVLRSSQVGEVRTLRRKQFCDLRHLPSFFLIWGQRRKIEVSSFYAKWAFVQSFWKETPSTLTLINAYQFLLATISHCHWQESKYFCTFSWPKL